MDSFKFKTETTAIRAVVFVIKFTDYMAYKFDIITIFPEIFSPYFNYSILKRAQDKKIIKIKIHNLRDFTNDKHKTVDDAPYGGGAGMVLKAEPIYKSLKKLTKFEVKGSRLKNINKDTKIVLLSPKGKQFNQKMANSFSRLSHLILICGHYEGVDERVKKFIDQEISIGPYVLTGGELPAIVMVDAITRLIPGVIKKESLWEETFSSRKMTEVKGLKNKYYKSEIVKEYPQYTRPSVLTIYDSFSKIFQIKTPKVLLSGNHQKIKKWREKHTVL